MATKSKTLLYCAVCLNQYQAIVVRGEDKLARHGFSVVGAGRGHGHLGAWHTGPCMGTQFPHLGISTAGTEAALARCREALADTTAALTEHAARPALIWTYTPSKWVTDAARRAGRPVPAAVDHTVKPGDVRQYGDEQGHPGYDDLWARRAGQLTSQAGELRLSIATYARVIGTWTAAQYAPVVTAAGAILGGTGLIALVAANREVINAKGRKWGIDNLSTIAGVGGAVLGATVLGATVGGLGVAWLTRTLGRHADTKKVDALQERLSKARREFDTLHSERGRGRMSVVNHKLAVERLFRWCSGDVVDVNDMDKVIEALAAYDNKEGWEVVCGLGDAEAFKS